MSATTNKLMQNGDIATQHEAHASGATVLAYGIAAYLIGFTGLLVLILAMANIIPLGHITPFTSSPYVAIACNVLLTTLFGLQHSIMARPWFKRRFALLFSQAAERSTFVLSSGVVTMIVVFCWQPVEGIIWQAQSSASSLMLWGGLLFGWGYLFAATFAIDHFDLFGLRQVWSHFKKTPYQAPQFKDHWMYRFSRHPIMLGALIGMWCLPTMTASHFVFALTFTLYTFHGVRLEESDLIKQFGKTYLSYRKRVGMFISFK